MMDQGVFHEKVAFWFDQNIGAPTEVQKKAWPSIKKNQHTLISAPTGSGKTLAAFLAIIDTMVVRSLSDNLADETTIVYVSPLKALSNDIHKNLQVPLEGIKALLEQDTSKSVDIKVALRTGDTSSAKRTAMYKKSVIHSDWFI